MNAKTCQVIECVHQGCIKCACEMHDQCTNKHKVCKTHNQWSKHDKHE